MTTPVTLFALPDPAPPQSPDQWPAQLRAMHGVYGVTPGQTCGGCAHCSLRYGGARGYYKCTLYGRFTHGPGTDWRKSWPACGGWLSAADHALPAGWVLQRTEDGRWRASDGFHATTPAATREEAIEAGRAAVALWAGEVGP